MTWLEAIIIAFIVLGIGWTVWRGGQANPESTGALGQKVSRLSSKLTSFGERLEHVEEDVKELKNEVATTKDIERLEQLGDRTWQSVERIERIILERGLGK